MVRLKENKNYYVFIRYPEFQFHYGTIKSMLRDKELVVEMNFNSTMVRLKEPDLSR